MPEFELRYKEGFHDQARMMAYAAQDKAERIFNHEVSFECRLFEDSSGQPDFAIKGWVTDNDDQLVEKVIQVQSEVLITMQTCAYDYQDVECWWWRVKGKWSGAKGLKPRP